MTEELVAIRCVTCGKVLADKWVRYKNALSEGKKIKHALDELGLSRPCCRMRMMNPFKVVSKSERQIDLVAQKELIGKSPEHLSVRSTSRASSKGSLNIMKNNTNYTIVPQASKSQVSLPPVPSIAKLPSQPEISRASLMAGNWSIASVRSLRSH